MIAYPKGSYFLIFTQLCESFSFFGMRTLLVLFMIQKLGYESSGAIGIYALYTTLINLGGLAGGYCGDRILGFRNAVILGSVFIGCGHMSLTFEDSPFLFHLGLSCIIVGSCFFGVNMKALFGQLYREDDPLRESGYTLYYTGINFGGFSAAIACGYAAQIYGWHAGFGLAGLGMLIGLMLLMKNRALLQDKGEAPHGVSLYKKLFCGASGLAGIGTCMLLLQAHDFIIPILPIIGVAMVAGMLYLARNNPNFVRILSLCGFVGLYLIFFLVEDLMGTFLMIFCENQVNRQFGGIEIPSSALVAVNPLTIILLGTLFAHFMRNFSAGQTVQSMMRKSGIAFILLGTAFGILCLGMFFPDSSGLVFLPYVIMSFALIAIGELFIAPPLFAYCSMSIPSSLTGQAMGLLAIGRSYASLSSGILGQAIVQSKLGREAEIFAWLALILFVIAGCLVLGAGVRSKMLSRQM